MSDTYNMPPLGLFGKRCRIQHVSNMKDGFVYRIVNDGIRSNYWKELPLGRYGKEPLQHDTMEDVIIVVCDTLIDDTSHLERVALKDVDIINEREDVLDKIRAEIGMYYADCTLMSQGDCEECTENVFQSIFRIIDKYKAESEE